MSAVGVRTSLSPSSLSGPAAGPVAAGERKRVIIMGAAGRDFHDFNVVYRDDPRYEVVAFTATQIPDIEGRVYPPVLAGPLYPGGIPIHPEGDLPALIAGGAARPTDVVFAYSDIPYDYVMHRAALVLAAGANFVLLGPGQTMLRASRPVVSVCAVRTGAGKSQTTRRVARILKAMGRKVAVVRHPMPYGDLSRQVCQRFAAYADLDRDQCTIEEREEYEPHLDQGSVVYAGVDYGVILREAEREADVILWDGGNNDVPFFRPHLHIVLVDPHRPGHELRYFPGEANLRMADVVVVNKVDTADPAAVETVRRNVAEVNPRARIILAASPITVDGVRVPEASGEALAGSAVDAAAAAGPANPVRGQRVLVIEDGPTLTHGEMRYGAGMIAAHRLNAAATVDPRPWAVGSIARTYEKYPHLTGLLPAMGYGPRQIAELEQTINAVDCDLVLVATPIDLTRVARINKPSLRVRYELEEMGRPTLEDVLRASAIWNAGWGLPRQAGTW